MRDRLLPDTRFLYVAVPRSKVLTPDSEAENTLQEDKNFRSHVFYRQLLTSRNSKCIYERKRAAREIGQLGGLPTNLKEELFLPLLHDPNEEVRISAINAIPSFLTFAEPFAVEELQVRLLHSVIRDCSPYVRLAAANVVYKLFYDDPDLQEKLLKEIFQLDQEKD